MKLYDYHSGILVATFSEARNDFLNNWCEAHGFLPHHQVADGWVVINKEFPA